MSKFKIDKSLRICLLGSLFIALKMILNKNLFLIAFIALIIYGITIDKPENKIEYLLYFISWVYVIKFDFNQFSLFLVMSVIYCIVSVIYIIKKRYNKILLTYILGILLILIYTTFSLLMSGTYSIISTYGFLLNYLVIAIACIFVKEQYKFIQYTYMYTIGLLVGCLVRLLGTIFPTIEIYIQNMTRINTVLTNGNLYVRFAGLDLDPNYFSIQILIAISCLSVLIMYDKRESIKSSILIVVLSIFGLLSLSKMFLITFLLYLILIFIILLKTNIKKSIKYLISLLCIASIVGYYFYDYFYEAFLFRFIGKGNHISDITTGRSDIWISYIEEIFKNIKNIFIGKGIASEFLDGHISHNMYLIAIYKLGIIGIIIFLVFILILFRNLKYQMKILNSINILSINLLPLYIILVANLTLDSFLMDFFPIHIFLTMLCILFYKEKFIINISIK